MMKTVFTINVRWTVIYSNGVILLSLIGIVLTGFAIAYFNKKYKTMFNTYEN